MLYKMFSGSGLGLLTALWSIVTVEANRSCHFPESWRGSWYQSGLGEIDITANTVSKKGQCIKHYTDYYIIEKKEDNCMMCLLMLERHRNIIQYKESFCVENSNIQSICSLIQPEGVMYTLVRAITEPTEVIKCPFHGNFKVDYTDYAHDFCTDNTDHSFVETCQDPKALLFHFKHCSSTATLHDADLQLECVATWKEGSEDLLYGRFTGSAIARKDDSYRCFKFEKRGLDTYLSMSADATCRGLVSAEIGPVVMKLRKDNKVLATNGCSYPEWLAGSKWIEQSGQYTLSVNKHRHNLVMHGDSSATSKLTCSDFIEPTPGDYYFSGYFHSDSCTKKYNCVRVRMLHRSVFGFNTGHISAHPITAEACVRQLSDRPPQHLFMDLNLDINMNSCPLRGHYSMLTGLNDCQVNISVGCRDKHFMEVTTECKQFQDKRFKCETHWNEGNTINIVLRDRDKDNSTLCYNIKERDRGLRIKGCRNGIQDEHHLLENMLIIKEANCDDRPTYTTRHNQHRKTSRHRPRDRTPPERTKTTSIQHQSHVEHFTYPYYPRTQTENPAHVGIKNPSKQQTSDISTTETTVFVVDRQYSPNSASVSHRHCCHTLLVFLWLLVTHLGVL